MGNVALEARTLHRVCAAVSPQKEPPVAELAQVPTDRLGSRTQLGRERPDVDSAVLPGTNQDQVLALVRVDETCPFPGWPEPRLARCADVKVVNVT